MITGALDQIGAVTRELTTTEHEGRQARVLVATQTYPTDVADVWDALTSPDRIPRWFMPVSGDLRLGGHFQLEGNAGGTIQECDPPRSFAITWEYGGEVSWVVVRLEEATENRTTLVLRHIAHVDDTRWNEFGPGAVGVGWDMGLLGLALHLSTGSSMDPQQALEWTVSDEGREFIARSSDGWCHANVAAGADETAARAAADRTTAAYTGAEPE